MNSWQIKTFKTLDTMNAWLKKHDRRIEWHEVFINNAYGVEYRKLRKVY